VRRVAGSAGENKVSGPKRSAKPGGNLNASTISDNCNGPNNMQ